MPSDRPCCASQAKGPRDEVAKRQYLYSRSHDASLECALKTNTRPIPSIAQRVRRFFGERRAGPRGFWENPFPSRANFARTSITEFTNSPEPELGMFQGRRGFDGRACFFEEAVSAKPFLKPRCRRVLSTRVLPLNAPIAFSNGSDVSRKTCRQNAGSGSGRGALKKKKKKFKTKQKKNPFELFEKKWERRAPGNFASGTRSPSPVCARFWPKPGGIRRSRCRE